jgi:PAP2 superfamily
MCRSAASTWEVPDGICTESRPAHPPAYADDPASEFYALGLEVYTTSVHLTGEQRTIARYWADRAGTTGTPPGHWVAIVGQLARHEGLSLMAAAEAYVRVGLAVADAFISCWHTKYTYTLLRPETYITHLLDPTWLPLIITPGFPAYTSGHATQFGAAATVLTDLFGMKAFTDTLHQDHRLEPALAPRRFGSFEEAAEEAAMSRLYAGIHYPFDNDQGLAQGRCVGQVIVDRILFTRYSDATKEFGVLRPPKCRTCSFTPDRERKNFRTASIGSVRVANQ